MISAVPQLDIPEQPQFLGGGPAVIEKNTFIDCETTFLDSEDSALQPSGLPRSKTAPAHPAGIVSSMSPRPGWEHDESASPEWRLPGSPVNSTRCSSSVDPESSYGSPLRSAQDLEPMQPHFLCRAGTEELREEIEGLQAPSACLPFGSNTTAEPAVPGFRCQEILLPGALFKSDGSALSERLSPGFGPATLPRVMGSAWPCLQRVGSFAQEAPRRPGLYEDFDDFLTTAQLRYTWKVDAKKLNGNERQHVSRAFNPQAALPQDWKGKVPPGSFKMTLRTNDAGRRGGRTFKKDNGRAILELKCEENLSGEAPDLTFSFAIGHGNTKSVPGAQIIHNFAEHSVKACKNVELELFKAVDSVSETVDVELTVFLSAA